MAALDEKDLNDKVVNDKVVDDDTIIEIKTQSKTFTTTYNTIKQIPYLNAKYLWSRERSQPLIVDIPEDLMKEILAEHTIVTRAYLGLDEKTRKSGLVIHTDMPFNTKELVIYKTDDYVTFEYRNKFQTWEYNEKDKTYKRGKCNFTSDYMTSEEGIITVFAWILSHTVLSKDFL